ncbi:MAG: very short patch repair endonuclease [Candidatus Paceibacterota bacterium]|jgi:DNA mismatch endonuclease (patch repair protein)
MPNKKSKYLRDGRAPLPKNDSVSKVMRANKSKNTKPELIFRNILCASGIRGYQLNKNNLPGKPDIVFSKAKLAIFINGCFWHRCPYCKLTLPKSNQGFWEEKFRKNKIRDKEKQEGLEKLGWKVFVVWECWIKSFVNDLIRL